MAASPGDLDKGNISSLRDILGGPVWQQRMVRSPIKVAPIVNDITVLGVSEKSEDPFPFLKRKRF